MTEGPPEEPGWVVYGPAGSVVASGGQTVTDASAGAGEENSDGGD